MERKSLQLDAPRMSYDHFERVVLRLLAAEARAQGRPFQVESRDLDFGFDGYAPEGLGDLTGPTAVEVKLHPRSPDDLASRLRIQLSKSGLPEIQFLLLIIGEPVQQVARNRLLRRFSEIGTVKLSIWDADDLQDLANRHAEEVSDLLPNLTHQAIQNVVAKQRNEPESAWKSARDALRSKIRQKFLQDDIAFMIGAGASSDAGVPDWQSLLLALSVEKIAREIPSLGQNDIDTLAARLHRSQNGSPLLNARYIQTGMEGDFRALIRQELYRRVRPMGSRPLLEAIAFACRPFRDRNGVQRVITYNFDNLLEEELSRTGIEHDVLYRSSDAIRRGKLPVIHAHGFIPRDPNDYPGCDDAEIAFSEEGYHTLYADPYSWSNLVQLSALQDNACLFVGLSMTDPSLRRLLEIAARHRRDANPRHYAIMRRLTDRDFFTEDEIMSELVSADGVRSFLLSHHALLEATFRQLGVAVVWVSDYAEIPPLIREVGAAT